METLAYTGARRGAGLKDNTKRGIVFTVILLVVLFALGLRIEHPKSGLKNALGSAESSLAVYWHHSKLSVGEKVVVMGSVQTKNPMLAIVNNVSADSVDIQTDGAFERIPMKNVRGSLVMVFPFIGMLFDAIGL
ncbi:unannotated protein [freshwater metagenome]|uniref:Unannotated protein n=1 Tax=freshwater metagenome TaxID=449393 RepID=A0A6J7DYU4_9ZZZZ